MFNFSAVSDQTIVGKLIRLPLTLLPKQTVVPILQGLLKGKRWIAGSSNHGCWLGSFEYDKQLIFSKYINKGDCVYDIGANVGFYTLLSSQLVHNSGKVYSFEPVKNNISFLRKHLEINGITNVSVIDKAVGEMSGEAWFNEGTTNSDGRLSTSGTIRVDVISLDEEYDKGLLLQPSFMKIDVEGAEMMVLRGAEKLIESTKPTIVVATHSENLHGQCIYFLQSRGYTVTDEITVRVSTGMLGEILAIPKV